MIFIKLILILFLIDLSYENQCPSSDYCTCSPDLTIIKCTNRQLTNELLFNINNQLPRSTILLNLSSNILTSVEFLLNLNHLEILDLSFNKIHYLPSDFLSRFPHLTSLYLQNNSLQILPKTFRASSTVHLDLSNNPFHCTCQSKWYQSNSQLKNLLCQNQKPFHENDFCRTNQLFSMTPHKSQIAYENEPFLLNCSSNSKRYWTLNEKHYPSTITSSSYSTIIIDHLQMKHSGIWTCHYLNLNHSISLTILPSLVEQFCPSIRMNTSKGLFHWPRTLINNKIERKCPFGSAAWLRNSNEDARAWYTCSSNGNWMHLDLAQCAFQSNISRIFDYLSLTETNLLLRLIKYLSKLDKNLFDLNDMILLIDLIDEQQNKYQNQDRVTLIFHLTDFILQIKHNFTYSREYQMAITRLRFIIERLVDLTEQPWLYIGKELTAMSIQAPLTSTLCLIPNRSLLTILCEPDNRQHYESPLATIHFPPSSNRTTQKSLYQVIFYRQSILYVPNEKKTLINNPVLYIRPVSRYSSSPVGLTFYNPVNQASIGIWYSNQTTWQLQSSVCKINEQNSNLISTYCVLFNNNSLALTYLNDIDQHENGFFNKKYSQLTIYISSVLASSCFLVSIVCYICFSKIYQMPRRFFHCLINYWLNLTILIPLFAFGIQQIHYPILCELISTSLHFLCLTTILWLTLLTFLIWRKFHGMLTHNDYQRKPPVIMVDYDDDVSLPIVKLKPKSIVQLYLFVYGIGFLICGIDMIVSREEYIIKTICFSKHFDSILLLIIPIFIFIFFSLILLLITRHYIKHLTEKQISRRNCSDQTILHSENLLPSRRNKILPIFVPSNLNPYHSPSEDSYLSDTDYQYESINQLLSILCQFILLILLFLSSSTIYLQPLHSFKLRFEYIIYSHLYGFFVLFLAFYILSYHILSRSNLIKRYYFHRNNEHNLRKEFYRERPISSAIKHFDLSSCTEQVSLLPSTHACYLSNRDICQIPQQTERTTIYNEHMYDSKPIVKVASEHYALHRHISKTNSSEHAPLFSALDVIAHRNTNRYRPQRNSLYERSLKRSTYYPIESHILQDKNTHLSSSSFPSCQSFTYPRISPCQAIIRPIPITRLSTLNAINNLSNSTHILQSNTNRNSLLDQNHLTTNKRRSFHLISSSSHDDYQSAYASLNKLDYSIQQESSDDNSSSQKNSAYQCIQVEYIDEMEDGSVSLKQSICDSKESLDSLSTKKSNSPTIVSSSLDSENDIFIVNQLPLHESIV